MQSLPQISQQQIVNVNLPAPNEGASKPSMSEALERLGIVILSCIAKILEHFCSKNNSNNNNTNNTTAATTSSEASTSTTADTKSDSVESLRNRNMIKEKAEEKSNNTNNITASSEASTSTAANTKVDFDGGNKDHKPFMLSASQLEIEWGHTAKYWCWISHPYSRFPEVAELLEVYWLEISGTVKATKLSPQTTYAAYFIFNLTPNSSGFDCIPLNAHVHSGQRPSTSTLSLQTREKWKGGNEVTYFPRARMDGWMEIAMGEFFIKDGSGEVFISLSEKDDHNCKKGLIVEGIEFRPKN